MALTYFLCSLDPIVQVLGSLMMDRRDWGQAEKGSCLLDIQTGSNPLVSAYAVSAQFQAGRGTTTILDSPQAPMEPGVALPSGPIGVIPEWQEESKQQDGIPPGECVLASRRQPCAPDPWAGDACQLLPSQGFPCLLQQKPVPPGGTEPPGSGRADTYCRTASHKPKE